jgi:NAD(P)-dependent dehydrogenase (short-subunit alcohol dehydrogenase family)
VYKLEGKVVVVTGAASGIGFELAKILAAKGCRLALADINAEGLKAATAQLPGNPLLSALDVSDRNAFAAFAAEVQRHYGAVHVVINNAGIARAQRIADIEYADFERVMNINFWGVVYGTKAFLPKLLEQDDGIIVNVASLYGLVGFPRMGAYASSKFAVRGFCEVLRAELQGTGVRVVAVFPGGIKTPIGAAPGMLTDGGANRLALTSVARAAAEIVRGIERVDYRVVIGPDARWLDRFQRWMPTGYWNLLVRVVRLFRFHPRLAGASRMLDSRR